MKNPREITALILILLCLCFSFCREIPAQETQFDEKSVTVSGTRVPINESSRHLITGIDLDKMLSRYINDYKAFEQRGMIPFPIIHGMRSSWSVKPIPGDSTTDYVSGIRRSEPFFNRHICKTIAIAKSHRNALLAAKEYFNHCSAPAVVSYLDSIPGFVLLHNDLRVFVLDNIFAALTISGNLNSEKIITRMIDDLQNGGEGIFKGISIAAPSLSYDGPLTNLTLGDRYTLAIPIQAIEPNNHPVALDAEIKNIEYLNTEGDKQGMPKPMVSVNNAGQIEINYKGPSFSADLIVNAVNNLGVASEAWIRRIQVNGE